MTKRIISETFHNIYAIFSKLLTTNKEALLFRAKPLPVGSKIVTSSTSLSMSPQF